MLLTWAAALSKQIGITMLGAMLCYDVLLAPPPSSGTADLTTAGTSGQRQSVPHCGTVTKAAGATGAAGGTAATAGVAARPGAVAAQGSGFATHSGTPEKQAGASGGRQQAAAAQQGAAAQHGAGHLSGPATGHWLARLVMQRR